MLKRLTSKLLHLSMTWKSVLLLALVTGAVTGLLAQADFLSRTSFADITVSHEWWVFFALLILVNQTRWWEAGLKTLVFFLVSQTVVFLVEWPLAGEFYFAYWYRWMETALLTLPGGALVWFSRKENVLGDLILAVPLGLLGILGVTYILAMLQDPPFHLLTVLFCFLQAGFWLYALKTKPRDRWITLTFTVILAAAGCILIL